jgi:hypothetical protein
MGIHPPEGPIHSIKDFLLALTTITAGVLIALSLEGFIEWNHNRRLVREAEKPSPVRLPTTRRKWMAYWPVLPLAKTTSTTLFTSPTSC